ncbi:MAG: hypothetical protein ABR588_05170 [Sphingomicrobium sp.]|nr:hypothetical protein [Sphingomonadales bacterium]
MELMILAHGNKFARAAVPGEAADQGHVEETPKAAGERARAALHWKPPNALASRGVRLPRCGTEWRVMQLRANPVSCDVSQLTRCFRAISGEAAGVYCLLSTDAGRKATVNDVDNMLYMSSQSTGDGNLTITVNAGAETAHFAPQCARSRPYVELCAERSCWWCSSS